MITMYVHTYVCMYNYMHMYSYVHMYIVSKIIYETEATITENIYAENLKI